MSNLFDHLNKGIPDLHPYEPGRSIDEVVAEYKPEKVVKLASNENPLGPSPEAVKALKSHNDDLHLYPDGDSKKLKALIANHELLNPENIIIGNGSNEVLELAARAFLNKDSSALMSKHAFAVYKIVTQSNGSKIIEVPTNNWKHALNEFPRYLEDSTRVCFIANPNNPTGTYNTHQEFMSLMNSIPSSVLVILDLAYFEYVTEKDYIKINELLDKYNNLLITKTFSKIQGLASLRIGYGLASKDLIGVLNKIRQPFNSNAIAQNAACLAILDHEHINKSIELNSQQRSYLMTRLIEMGLECIPSHGNFISFKGDFQADELFINLMKEGVIVRPIALYDMPEFIRVTVGTKEENDYFLLKLGQLL
ncbi:MAG: histidinol-phosphate transaminase [SAR86 cluster bacterium]|nr:histidinol-phosphate transaminase [SAR86 cluster bacterium]